MCHTSHMRWGALPLPAAVPQQPNRAMVRDLWEPHIHLTQDRARCSAGVGPGQCCSPHITHSRQRETAVKTRSSSPVRTPRRARRPPRRALCVHAYSLPRCTKRHASTRLTSN